MKKSKCWAFIALLAFTGCNQSESEIEVTTDDIVHPVEFSLLLSEEILPFPGTRSMPPLDIPEPKAETKGDEEKKKLCDLCTTIEYIVYKKNQNSHIRKKSYTLQENNLDFGIISDNLPEGEYEVILIAHNTAPGELKGNIMSFNKVSDSFHLAFPLTVTSGQQYKENVTLFRIVSKVEFVSKDNVADNAKNFTMEAERYPDQLNIRTGDGVVSQENAITFTYNFQPEDIGKTGFIHDFFTFVPDQSATMDVTLISTDDNDAITRERKIEDITPIRNRVIRYTGYIYTYSPSDDEFTIIIDEDGKWGEPVDNELED